MTSQTCLYCFSKLDHPIQRKTEKGRQISFKSKGSFLCRNPKCVVVRNNKASKSRGPLSALAIGISGLCKLLFKQILPIFSPRISHSNTDFISITSSLLNTREWQGHCDASTL
ncbi:hypothetical protein BCV72DRAFT_91333 [Rhizopus microsporus var. microsporus]|uniref:Uncharacterized protein n=1 Tax=Rhizopus microsporus var. microsporus TaxID=86635 RepID=A0A1X0R8F6_RHIZD|nr:hypothetical protein BCV72DRAFT_91333 [Rhizopus microsporus var. microsporus]